MSECQVWFWIWTVTCTMVAVGLGWLRGTVEGGREGVVTYITYFTSFGAAEKEGRWKEDR